MKLKLKLMMSLLVTLTSCSVGKATDIEFELKPYCYSRSEAERIFVCLKERENNLTQDSQAFSDTWLAKTLIFAAGVTLGIGLRERIR